jgi:hypothetical protein
LPVSGAALAQTEACGGAKPKLTKKVDKPLGEAQKARDAKNWEEVLVKVAEAEAVPVDKSVYDTFWMNEFKGIAHANLKKFPEALAELEAGMKSPCMAEDGKALRSKVLMQLAYQARTTPRRSSTENSPCSSIRAISRWSTISATRTSSSTTTRMRASP